jgi:hypothetical protein
LVPRPQASRKQSIQADPSRSQWPAQYRDQILAKIEQGLKAQRIYRDLVSEYGFSAKSHSVQRFVGNLLESKELPFATVDTHVHSQQTNQ